MVYMQLGIIKEHVLNIVNELPIQRKFKDNSFRENNHCDLCLVWSNIKTFSDLSSRNTFLNNIALCSTFTDCYIFWCFLCESFIHFHFFFTTVLLPHNLQSDIRFTWLTKFSMSSQLSYERSGGLLSLMLPDESTTKHRSMKPQPTTGFQQVPNVVSTNVDLPQQCFSKN